MRVVKAWFLELPSRRNRGGPLRRLCVAGQRRLPHLGGQLRGRRLRHGLRARRRRRGDGLGQREAEQPRQSVVQRNTSSGWSVVGADDGRIPQFTQHGLIQDTGWSMRLLPVGS